MAPEPFLDTCIVMCPGHTLDGMPAMPLHIDALGWFIMKFDRKSGKKKRAELLELMIECRTL